MDGGRHRGERAALGGLVLHRDDELPESDQRILERAALVTALLLLIRRTAGEAENRVRGELLEELLTSSARDPDGLRERARRLGADLDRPLAVAVARVEERRRARALAAADAPGRHPRRARRPARRLRRRLPARSGGRRDGGDRAPRADRRPAPGR